MAGRGLRYQSRTLLCFILVAVWEGSFGQIHYLIPEEMEKGSFVGDVAKDLALNIKELSDNEVQIISRGMKQYFDLDSQNGHLLVNDVIDREQICHQMEKCILNFKILVKEKMKFFTAEVEIADINDNSPSFPIEELEFRIAENTGPGARFLLPEAQDPDLGTNSLLSYHLSSNKHFYLDVQTGVDGVKYAELVLETLLDREEQRLHQLILTAADKGNPIRSGTVQIRVAVTDVNDNAPVFSASLYEVNVVENIPKGSRVLTLNATDDDEGINSKIKYSFRKVSDKASKIFRLDSSTGQISVTGNLDYEDSKFHEMEVQAQDGAGLSTRAKAVIRILDANDNAPEITITPLFSKILESSPPGSAIALVNINDRDDGRNGEVTCSIPATLPFLLKKSFDNYYSLETDQDLDRESVSEYNITITATDQGTPSLSATAYFLTEILDENDNPPIFKTTAFTFQIAENNQRGDLLLNLKANDPDCGENGRIIYSIIETNIGDVLLSSYLSINSETGAVYALSSFDYEEFREIKFQVKAQDGGSPPLSSNITVTLFILDRNDNAPQILYPSVPTDGSTGVELAPHSSEPGYLVTKVVAVDADSGQNAWLSYQLLKATEPGLFTIGLHTGEIRTARPFLDKDALKQSLVVLVKDNGQPPLSASVTVTVVLADSIPEVLTDLSSISAPADPQSDLTFYLVVAVAFVSCLFFTFLLVLLAVRLHRWRTSHLCNSQSVNFTGVPVSQFVGIDGVRAFLHSYCHNGSLTTCSRKSQILFPVGSCTSTLAPQHASDKSGPLVTLDDSSIANERQISEQNCLRRKDNLWIDKHTSNSEMGENHRSQYYRIITLIWLLKMIAWEPVSGQVHYMILEETERGSFVGNVAKDLELDMDKLSNSGVHVITTGKSQYFALNMENGHLYTSEKIDREMVCGQVLKCLLKFEILVQDKMKVYTVEVEIADINDNTPRFQMEQLTFSIRETTAQGSRFLLADAVDPDVGINSIQRYELSSNKHFSLYVQTGESGVKNAGMILENSLDREEKSFHNLVLVAFDGGDPVRSGSVPICVTVLDANDNAPVFTQPIYKVSVLENVPLGFVLTTVKATDLDEGLNSEITYSFRTKSDKISQIFLMNSQTGEISVQGNLDFEEMGFFEIDVQAQDPEGLSSLAKVFVTVMDANDNAPEITLSSFFTSVPEDSQSGTLIALLRVKDKDSGENGKVSCSVPPNLPFQLQKSVDNFYTLVTDGYLDREVVEHYNLTITATDRGTPLFSTTVHLPIRILDINDNAPIFKQKFYNSYLFENNPTGTSLMTLEANDPDWGTNCTVTYSILDGNDPKVSVASFLSVNTETGVVYALRPFDYEELRELNFWVKAQDGGSPPLGSNVSVTLFILDQNDNGPQILYPAIPTDGSTGIELAPHSSEPGYLVTKVVAVDADSGQNAWLSYQLLKATEPGLFTIGLHTGEIRTARPFLDKDALKQSLVVLVKDNGQPPLSASVTVTVVLADSIPEVLTDLSSISTPADPKSDLTFYLVVAVAFVSCLFFTFLLVLLAIRLYRWRNSQLCDSGSVNFSGVPVSQFVGIDGVRAFLRSYCQEVSLTTDSRKSQIIFPIGSCTNTLTPQQTCIQEQFMSDLQ
ncbi:protocadherin Fat 2-like [Eublepharis macularius]|uniref:Protocadherin Fat 2-like n=1 Tax=Eublepharis macularius TaxID=481883 RepID=A0AA97JM70_EUBMA|nr:protocadherin Fat 2-like [Eublepharis macularius]